MINDEDLILFHYEDGLEPAQRERIAQALASDAQLSARYARLQAELNSLAEDTEAPPLEPAIQQRWRQALAREARLEQPIPAPTRWHWLRWPGLGSAVAAAVLVSFGIGLGQWLQYRPDPQPQLTPASANTGNTANASGRSPLLRGVQLHLQDTEALLPLLSSQDAAQRRSLLAETRAQNRMYARAAQAQNDQQLARVLRAFDQALANLASERDDPEALAADQAQLEFELAAMQTKLASAASKQGQSL